MSLQRWLFASLSMFFLVMQFSRCSWLITAITRESSAAKSFRSRIVSQPQFFRVQRTWTKLTLTKSEHVWTVTESMPSIFPSLTRVIAQQSLAKPKSTSKSTQKHSHLKTSVAGWEKLARKSAMELNGPLTKQRQFTRKSAAIQAQTVVTDPPNWPKLKSLHGFPKKWDKFR